MPQTFPSLTEFPHEFAVSSRIASALVESIESIGVGSRQLLCRAHLRPEALGRGETRISCLDLYQLYEAALDLTGDEALGLHWAERSGIDRFEPLVAHMFIHAPTLRRALEVSSRCSRLLTDEPSFVLCESNGQVSVRCVRQLPFASSRIRRFAAEMLLGSAIRLARQFHRDAKPDHVRFAYSQPTYGIEYTRLFGVTPSFGQAHTEIVFDRAWMDAPSSRSDSDVHDALRSIAERRVMQLAGSEPFWVRARDVLVRQPLGSRVNMHVVARAVGLSPRSLRRRLDDEGKPFTEISKEALGLRAQNLLRNTDISIQELGYQLGFANTSAFHRAFKRATGTTPHAYRAAARTELAKTA